MISAERRQMNMGFNVLVTDKINEIAVKILQGVCEVDYKPVMTADELKSIISGYDALMIRSSSRAKSLG
jgi:hypothetical protein